MLLSLAQYGDNIPSAAIRAAVETARYELHQACLRRLPAPPSDGHLRGMGGESPEGDLAYVAREFIRRAEHRITPGLHSLSPYYARFSYTLPNAFSTLSGVIG
jgi:hypothetical protein